MSQRPCRFEKEVIKNVTLNYLLYLPKDYEENEKKRPLILFLHGAGECGDDLEIVKRNGIPKIAEEKNLPFIAVSPQCPEGSWWGEQIDALNALLDDIITNFNADSDRIYLTGLSMGGYGTWIMAQVSPERFAAIASICGGGDADSAYLLKDIPVWAFHGVKDDVVPIEESEAMIEELEKRGGNVRFTRYEDAGHDSWTRTYENPELYEWFLSWTKK